ncbi:MAG: transglutaminase-like domain-containing protein [Methanomassiliicoccales archaeon]
MRRAFAIAASIVLLASFVFCCLIDPAVEGFNDSDLKAPCIVQENEIPIDFPSSLTSKPQVYTYSLRWEISDVYAYYGGVMSLEIRNKGQTAIFVYGYGLKWVNYTEEYFKTTSAYVFPSENASIGLLKFYAPSDRDVGVYTIVLKLCVSNPSFSAWYDYGEVESADRAVAIKPLAIEREYLIKSNLMSYFNRVKSLVNCTAVSDVVKEIKNAEPGNYSTLQIARAFQWVRDHIEYEKENETDIWQSAEETLMRKRGDCEDQAILLASIITALGGNARINFIEGHAFTTVFISMYQSELANVEESLWSYYGTNVTMHIIHYMGYWLVIDTAGSMYAGGLPANASPIRANSNAAELTKYELWTFVSTNWLISIDALQDR